MHRRVITEVDEMHPHLLAKDYKKTDKINPKPKFLDVYSKYVNKNAQEPKKTLKVVEIKPLTSEKHLKT